MQQALEEAYQKAVSLVEAYRSKGVNTLSEAEKEELNRTLKQIQEYTPAAEPLTITELP